MRAAGPVAVVFDPLTWLIDWPYDIERDRLDRHGVDLVVPEDEKAAAAAIVDADAVVVSDGKFGRAQIATLRRCVGIVCYGVGMDQVDAEAADQAGIPIRNVPGFCTDEVADQAMVLLLAAERRLLQILEASAGGDWEAGYRAAWPIRRLRGQTLGVVGSGRIGKQVARKARAFGFRTLAYDPFITSTGDADLPLIPLDELLISSDAVVVCAALTPTSRGLISAGAIARMRASAILVNIARGPIIDEQALAGALRSGHLAGAALDVRAHEPPSTAPDPLAGCPNLIVTPHIGGASVEARVDLHTGAADAVIDVLRRAGRIGKSRRQSA